VTGAGSTPSPSPLRAVAKAEAAKAHAYNEGKAVERMSTFQTMKFDVQDATKRGILKAPPPGAGSFRLIVHNMWEVLVCFRSCVWNTYQAGILTMLAEILWSRYQGNQLEPPVGQRDEEDSEGQRHITHEVRN
jgi:hypothetical protein